jgi:hypothetical protein
MATVRSMVSRAPTPSSPLRVAGSKAPPSRPPPMKNRSDVGARLTIERTVAINGVPFALTAFGYLDHGYVRSNGARPSDDAGSVALGVRGVRRALSVTLEAAVPVVSPQTPSLIDDDARLLFSVSQRF